MKYGRAMDLMRLPGTFLLKTHRQTEVIWRIHAPFKKGAGGEITEACAKKILDSGLVMPSKDGFFGASQTWKIAA